MAAMNAPTMANIEKSEGTKNDLVDQKELTTYLQDSNITKENKADFVTMINKNKDAIKNLPGFSDSLEEVAKKIAMFLQNTNLQKLKKDGWEIPLLEGNIKLTKVDCAKILQVYAAIILNQTLTTTAKEYTTGTSILADFDNKNTFGPQMLALMETLTSTAEITTDAKNKTTNKVIEAGNTRKLENAKKTAIDKIQKLATYTYDEAAMEEIDGIKEEGIQDINQKTTVAEIETIITEINIKLNRKTDSLLTEKKNQIIAGLNKKSEENYSDENSTTVAKLIADNKTAINAATTPEEIDQIIASKQAEIKKIPTKYQEKETEQNTAKQEANANLYSYQEVGKEWKVTKVKEVKIDVTRGMSTGASMPKINEISSKINIEMKDESAQLTAFMNLNAKKENFFTQLQKRELGAFLGKNYPSLQKNEKINNHINNHIKEHLKDKNHELNINFLRKGLTDISMEIDKTTGEYYFNIPAEGNFRTNQQTSKINALHLSIKGDVTPYDETKNPDPILASIYTPGTLAYTLTHNKNSDFSSLPENIVPGTYADKKQLLIQEAINSIKGDNTGINYGKQNYSITLIESGKIGKTSDKIFFTATRKTGIDGDVKEGKFSVDRDGNVSRKVEAEAIIKKDTPLETTDVKYPTSQKEVEDIINFNNNIM